MGKTRNITGAKGLSSALLQMKFMQRTRKRLEEESKKKEEKKLQKHFLRKERNGNETLEKSETADTTAEPSVKFENRYDLLEDLAFGRMSFKGFNPEVEKLMKYYKDLKEGKVPEEFDLEGELDITDHDLAASVFGSKSGRSEKGILRKYKDEDRNLIDETNEHLGKRRRQVDRRESELRKK